MKWQYVVILTGQTFDQSLVSVGIAVFSWCAVGCGGDRVASPPMSRAITNQAGASDSLRATFPFHVECDGPEDEVRLLAGVCGADTSALNWTLTDAPAGMGTRIGPLDGPFFMLFNRLGYEPDHRRNVAAELEYAAYFVQRGNREDIYATLEQWKFGESVSSGSVVTFDAYFVACNTSWRGEGSFLWRATTLRFAWTAAQGC